MVTYAYCFKSKIVGVVQDYKSCYFLIRFPSRTMWVHENYITWEK